MTPHQVATKLRHLAKAAEDGQLPMLGLVYANAKGEAGQVATAKGDPEAMALLGALAAMQVDVRVGMMQRQAKPTIAAPSPEAVRRINGAKVRTP